MLYREIIAVCSQIHTKHVNTLNVKDGAVNAQSSKATKQTIPVCTGDCLHLFNSQTNLTEPGCVCALYRNALPPSSEY